MPRDGGGRSGGGTGGGDPLLGSGAPARGAIATVLAQARASLKEPSRPYTPAEMRKNPPPLLLVASLASCSPLVSAHPSPPSPLDPGTVLQPFPLPHGELREKPTPQLCRASRVCRSYGTGQSRSLFDGTDYRPSSRPTSSAGNLWGMPDAHALPGTGSLSLKAAQRKSRGNPVGASPAPGMASAQVSGARTLDHGPTHTLPRATRLDDDERKFVSDAEALALLRNLFIASPRGLDPARHHCDTPTHTERDRDGERGDTCATATVTHIVHSFWLSSLRG